MGQEPTHAQPDPHEHGTVALERLGAFSDAVFAIAMTLLVLDIPRPGPGQESGPSSPRSTARFVAFFISFWVIAMFWMGHHRLFRFMRFDQGVVALNLSLLF